MSSNERLDIAHGAASKNQVFFSGTLPKKKAKIASGASFCCPARGAASDFESFFGGALAEKHQIGSEASFLTRTWRRFRF